LQSYAKMRRKWWRRGQARIFIGSIVIYVSIVVKNLSEKCITFLFLND